MKNKSTYSTDSRIKYNSQGYAQFHKNNRKRARRFKKGLATLR